MPLSATDLKSKIAGLNDAQAVWAVEFVGNSVAAAVGQAPAVLTRKLRALSGFDSGALPILDSGELAGDAEDRARAGAIARFALTHGADDEREAVRLAVAAAVAQAMEPDVRKELIAALLIGGGVLIGLAVLGKVEITAEGKFVLHTGLPGINDAGAAVGALIKNALGLG